MVSRNFSLFLSHENFNDHEVISLFFLPQFQFYIEFRANTNPFCFSPPTGSLTPSSPSSDELSTSMEANGQSYNQLPYNSAGPHPKQMTDDPKLGFNNAGERPTSKYTNIAQNSSGFSHPSLFNQNIFTSPVRSDSHFDAIGEMNSSFVARESTGKMADSTQPSLPEKPFAPSSQQLPDSRPQGQNISSFFTSANQTNSDFHPSVSTNGSGRM